MKLTRMIFILMFVAVPAFAQEDTTTTTTTTAPEERTGYANSEETRQAFLEVLGKYPPQVSKVLKLDPTLFSNAAYLANYPALAEFVARHPEVTHTPAFFLESVWANDLPPVSASQRMWEQTLEGIFIFTTIFLVAGTLMWIMRTLIEHRRWSRLSRTQIEVHGKLMDRLSSNEDLFAYMQTAAGKRFLESAPIPLDSSPRAVGAPIGRILWSVQVGLIMAMAGVGLQFVARTVDKDASQPLLAMGVLAMAVGFGFLLSALVSFLLSKRLGLLVETTPAE
ncbi:MAG: hypothetical protein ACJ74H_00065 [Thermoanaerobaculia bacterium]